MLTLSIRQPYASLVVAGIKDVENRAWATSHRGPLLIHATTRDAELSVPEWARLLEGLQLARHALPRGCVVGQVDVIDCARHVDSPWHEPGAWGWTLANAVRFDAPIHARGFPGLWSYSPATHEGPAAPRQLII